MGRQPIGTPTEFSRQITRTIEELRAQTGISNSDLIGASGLSANYYYIRMREEAPFNTNDLGHIAAALDVDPVDILRRASGPATVEHIDTRTVRVEGRELARRLRLLTTSTPDRGTDIFEPDALVAHLAQNGTTFSAERWDALLVETDSMRISRKLLNTIASYFEVDAAYLDNTNVSEVSKRIDARLEFQQALRATGAQTVAARALGDISPDALRAITKAILSQDENR
jgi:transcriptional regulator with XRE-family HTH domain